MSWSTKGSARDTARSGKAQASLVHGCCKLVSEHPCPLRLWGTALTRAVDDDDSRAVINHNPLPDITHEEFVSILGPLLAPENYAYTATDPAGSPTSSAHAAGSGHRAASPPPGQPRPSMQSGPPPGLFASNPNSPAPFDWLHFEGRSVKTTLSNITGLDGLARERKWRSHCVFSVDVGRKGRQGVEAVLVAHSPALRHFS